MSKASKLATTLRDSWNAILGEDDMLEIADLLDKYDALEVAARELLELKMMKDTNTCLTSLSTMIDVEMLRAYQNRKPITWDALRAALAALK